MQIFSKIFRKNHEQNELLNCLNIRKSFHDVRLVRKLLKSIPPMGIGGYFLYQALFALLRSFSSRMIFRSRRW